MTNDPSAACRTCRPPEARSERAVQDVLAEYLPVFEQLGVEVQLTDEPDREKLTAQAEKVTEGTKIAAKARAKCNGLSDAKRQELTAIAMRMIYHAPANSEKPLAHRR